MNLEFGTLPGSQFDSFNKVITVRKGGFEMSSFKLITHRLQHCK